MGAFGDRLRREREQRKLSLEEISQATKINARSLQALEQEDFRKLPGGVFNRGFVRAYARHLGLDEDTLIAAYLEVSGDSLPSPAPEAEPAKAAEEPENRDGWPRGITLSLVRLTIGGTLLVLLVLGALWWRRHQSPSAVTPPPTATQAQPVASPPAPSQKTEPATAWSNVIPQSAAQSQPVAQSGDAIELSLHALDEVWLSAAIDGQPAREDTLFVGNRRTLRAHEKIVLKVGNAGSLEVSFNGKALPSLGDDGQVKTVVFLPTGLQAPTQPAAHAN